GAESRRRSRAPCVVPHGPVCFSTVFSSFNPVFPTNVAAPVQEKPRDEKIPQLADFAFIERIAGCLTLLTSRHGRDEFAAMAETVGSTQAAGQPGHFQALVFRGETGSGDRGSVHLPRAEQHLSILDRE